MVSSKIVKVALRYYFMLLFDIIGKANVLDEKKGGAFGTTL
jgi:hypothetical protein